MESEMSYLKVIIQKFIPPSSLSKMKKDTILKHKTV